MRRWSATVEQDRIAFERAQSLYAQLRAGLAVRVPGFYFLVHTSTLLFALGDPSKDEKGGYSDAMKNFREQHGDRNGQYFGVKISGTKARVEEENVW